MKPTVMAFILWNGPVTHGPRFLISGTGWLGRAAAGRIQPSSSFSPPIRRLLNGLNALRRSLLPLNSGGGFSGNIINHPVDMGCLTYDPVGDPGQHFRGETVPIGRCSILTGYGTEGNGVGVSSLVVHNPDRTDIR